MFGVFLGGKLGSGVVEHLLVLGQSSLQSSNLSSQSLEVSGFLIDEHLEVHSLGETWTVEWSVDLWLLPDGTFEHLVAPVVDVSTDVSARDVDSLLDDLGDLDDLVGSDESLVDSSDSNLSDVNLVDKLVDLSSDRDLFLLENNDLVDQMVDELLDDLNLLDVHLGDVNLLELDDSDLSDLSDDLVDDSSDVDDLLSDDNNLLLEDVDLLNVDDLLGWVSLDENGEVVDLLLDDSQLVDQVDDLLDVNNDDLLELLVNDSLVGGVDTGEVWSSVAVKLALDESVWLVTGFSEIS